MQFQQKWRIFFFKTNIFLPESEVKKNMKTIYKKTKKVIRTRRMHVWKRCWKIQPEVRTITAQSSKTFEKIRKNDTHSQSGPLDT